MKYKVKIRYIDGKEIYPIAEECDEFRIYEGILVLSVFRKVGVESTSFIHKQIGIPLQHIRSYDIEDKGEVE